MRLTSLQSLLLPSVLLINQLQCTASYAPVQSRVLSSPLFRSSSSSSLQKYRYPSSSSSIVDQPTFQQRTTSTYLASSTEDAEDAPMAEVSDPVIRDTSIKLRRLNWISWWAQIILTVVSSVTLLFARTILNASTATAGGAKHSPVPGGFLFAGSGIALSYVSIIWTWGGTRLSRRLLRNLTDSKPSYSRIKVATMIRRAIAIGTTLNLVGMLVTLIGAEQIVGLLAAKVLTMQGISPFGIGGGLAGAAGLSTQAVQPLDVLIVQANTNTLLSHFASLVCCLILTRSVHLLDPPSEEDDEK